MGVQSAGSDLNAADVHSILVDGGTGSNAIDLSGVTKIAFTSLTSLTINGNGADDVIVGSEFRDVINGGLGKDSLTGGAGNDTISGGAGLDKLEMTATIPTGIRIIRQQVRISNASPDQPPGMLFRE